jgi:hypothetical protein
MQDFSVSAEKHVQKQLANLNVQTLDQLPKEMRKQLLREARQIARNDVFGHGHKTTKDGTPIEQGLGSHENPSPQSIEAYIRPQSRPWRDSPEPGYEEHLKKLRARLAEVDAVRRAQAKTEEEDF